MLVHRITGRHQFISQQGAAVWVDTNQDVERIVGRIRQGAARLSILVEPVVWSHDDGVAIAIEFPTDVLYTACELLEWAVEGEDVEQVLSEYHSEENLNWRYLKEWATTNKVPFIEDEDGCTLGLGCHSTTWTLDNLPERTDLNSAEFRSIPCVYITGTNGKTTTSRLLANVARCAGYVDGLTSSDGVLVGGRWVEKGDWTGPGAARLVLRHPEVQFAVLETARGGLMRRGLVLCDVDAAAVTNVSDDHLGHWGLHTVKDMAKAKLSVALGIQTGGALILNADNAALVGAWKENPRKDIKVRWFSSTTKADISLDGNWIVHYERGRIIQTQDIPLALGGAAVHNVENAMVAIGLACATGIPTEAIRKGLSTLLPNPENSRGRSNWYRKDQTDIILDFAHNPDGIRRLVDLGNRWTAKKRTILLGQASDRSDAQLHSLAKEASLLKEGQFVLKELPKHAYGEDPNLVVSKIRESLIVEGVSERQIMSFKDEVEAVHSVLQSSVEGEIILLVIHENLDAVLNLLIRSGADLVVS